MAPAKEGLVWDREGTVSHGSSAYGCQQHARAKNRGEYIVSKDRTHVCSLILKVPQLSKTVLSAVVAELCEPNCKLDIIGLLYFDRKTLEVHYRNCPSVV